MDKATGFTDKQRQWFLDRDGHQCSMHLYINGKWTRCKNTSYLQVHHLIPRGFASLHYPKDFPVNGYDNGIVLCRGHHISFGYTGDPVYVIHPDTEGARIAYAQGDKLAYEKMMKARSSLNDRGILYHNTLWDSMFIRIVMKANALFLPQNPYPLHGKFGMCGR